MAVTQYFLDAVKNKNLISVRVMMKNSLWSDPTFKEFNEMARVARNLDGLYESYDERELIWDKSAWNEDYLNTMLAQLLMNFSNERIGHLRQIITYLHPSSDVQLKVVSNKQIRPASYNQTKKQTAIGAGIGALTGGTTACFLGAPVMAGAAIGAVAGMIGGYLVTRRVKK